jgi:hypothetical protein
LAKPSPSRSSKIALVFGRSSVGQWMRSGRDSMIFIRGWVGLYSNEKIVFAFVSTPIAHAVFFLLNHVMCFNNLTQRGTCILYCPNNNPEKEKEDFPAKADSDFAVSETTLAIESPMRV